MVRGPATILTFLVKNDHHTHFRWIPCAVLRCLVFKTTNECEAHAAFPVESEGFGVLDCGATTSFGTRFPEG